MKRIFIITVAALLAAAVAPAQDWAKTRLEKSPRHGEWVKIPQGKREVNSFITYPEVKDKATAVVVIHEIFGLTDWARGVTDQLAEAGYIAIAPDLLSGLGPKGGGTSELGGIDNVRKAISSLPRGPDHRRPERCGGLRCQTAVLQWQGRPHGILLVRHAVFPFRHQHQEP